MQLRELAQHIKTAPRTPGVYTWRDSHGKPLYIGKASNLKARLSSYRKTIDPRIVTMIERASAVDWQITDTDIEALITEAQLIKRWRPQYNIVMRDDKQYFFVAVTDEDFPHIFLTHQPLNTKNSKLETDFIGPFTEGLPLKSTLRVLRRLFPYCTCKQKHHLRCLNAHIGKCPGYCCLKTPATAAQKRAYRKNIAAIKDILTGKRGTVITRFAKNDPDIAIRLMRVFQNAQINARRQAMAPQHAGALEQLEHELGLGRVPHRIEGYDIANIQGQHATGAMVAFIDGRPDNQEYRKFTIKTVTGAHDVAMLTEVITRRFHHPEWRYPDLILVDGAKAQLNAATKAVASLQLSVPIIAVTKDEKHRASHLIFTKNSKLKTKNLSDLPRPLRDLVTHIDAEAHRFAISHYRQRHQRSLKK